MHLQLTWRTLNLSIISDADLERLLEQWEEDEEDLPPGTSFKYHTVFAVSE